VFRNVGYKLGAWRDVGKTRRTGPGLGGRRAADGRPLCADAGGSYSSG